MSANVKPAKMAATPKSNKPIARLTPLAEVLATVEAVVRPVAAVDTLLAKAVGGALAADVTADARPVTPIAISDGWAVSSEATRDAGSYAPALLPQIPQRVVAGQPMPKGTDSVALADAVAVKAGRAQALASVDPGAGVLPAGGDSDGRTALRRAGERLRASDGTLLTALGVASVSLREPRVTIVARDDQIISVVAKLIATDIEKRGGTVREEADLVRALQNKEPDFVVAIGGTGNGDNDSSVAALAHTGQLKCHGIGIAPGETTAFGLMGAKPVLLLPGRADAALTAWLLIGRTILARLAGSAEKDSAVMAKLTRKVTSTVGLAEFVPVRRAGDGVEPMAAKYLPLSSLARADGWILVLADSEGYQAGSEVAVREWL